jgi:transcription initiation factor TFIID subunit 8
MYELGRSSRAFTEVACRSEPLPADILLALTEMGQTTVGIKEYAFRTGRRCLSNPGLAQPAKPTSILHTGDRKPRSKLLAEMCPEFPDSHSYLRTPTHKQPVTDYESVREKAASQKRDVERALTRFIAKTGKTHSLFNTDDTNMFPLISCDRIMPDQPVLPPYLNALLFKDQVGMKAIKKTYLNLPLD